MVEDDKSFVSRWSRLKRTGGDEGLPDPAVTAETPIAKASQGPEAAGEPDVEELVKSLPDIETMTEESDFTAFLQKGVPRELKQRALRRLWRLNPVFANLDGLNDYDEDFNAAALLVKNVKTLYEVGKGMPGPKNQDEDEEAEVASESDQDENQEAEDEDSAEVEPQVDDEEAETPQTATLADGERESSEPRTLIADAPPQLAEPAPIAAPQRGRAAQRRWGSSEG